MVRVRRIAGKSMLPALSPGVIIIAWTHPRRMRPGDVLLLHHEGIDKVKRLQAVDENAGRLYVVGDHPAYSTDSRDFGWIDRSAVVGKVVWPRI